MADRERFENIVPEAFSEANAPKEALIYPVIATWDPESDYIIERRLKKEIFPSYSQNPGLLRDTEYLRTCRMRLQFMFIKKFGSDNWTYHWMHANVCIEAVYAAEREFDLEKAIKIREDYLSDPNAARARLN